MHIPFRRMSDPLVVAGDYAPAVVSCGYDRSCRVATTLCPAEDPRIGNVSAATYRLLLVASGSLRRETVHVHERGGLIILPGDTAAVQVAPHTRLEHLIFTVVGKDRLPIRSPIPWSSIPRQPSPAEVWGVELPTVLSRYQSRQAWQVWNRIRALYARSWPDRLRADLVLGQWLIDLVAAPMRPPSAVLTGPDATDPIRRAQDRIRADLATGHRTCLARLARQVGLSVSTFRQHFLDHEGISPRNWLARERFTVAVRCLTDGLTVAAVARQIGFASTAAFCRAFRKYHGRCPGAWLQGSSQAVGPEVGKRTPR